MVLDYATGVCKVDLDRELSDLLKSAVEEIVEKEPAKARPREDRMAHIVDPHLAPLAYGRTKVLSEGGAVGLEDIDDWYGRGSLSARPEAFEDYPTSQEERNKRPKEEQVAFSRSSFVPGTLAPHFQWLPCEVAFVVGAEEPSSLSSRRPKVRIVSYINDLHPHMQAPAYRAIANAIGAAIASWNDILVPDSEAPPSIRIPPRIKTYGVQYPPSLPAFEEKFWEVRHSEADKEELPPILRQLEEEVARGMVFSRAELYGTNNHPYNYSGHEQPWEISKRLVHPEPGVSFSYEEWKKGGQNVNRAIVPCHPEPEADYEQYDSVSLQNEFRDLRATGSRPHHEHRPNTANATLRRRERRAWKRRIHLARC